MVLNLLKEIFKGTSIVIIGSLLGKGIEYIVRIIIARTLEVESFGIFNICYELINICVCLSLFGLIQGVSRYIPYYKEKGEIGKVKGTIICAIKIVLFTSIFISIIIFTLSNWLSLNIFHDRRVEFFLKIFIWSLPFMALVQLNSASLRGFKAVKYKIYSEDFFRGLFLLILVIIFLQFNLNGVAIAYLLSFAATTLLGIYYLNRKICLFDQNIKTEAIGMEILQYSGPLIFSTILNKFQLRFGILLLGYWSIPSQIGLYSSALIASQLINLIIVSIGFIFLPIVSELYASGKYAEIKKIYGIITKWIFFITLPISLIFLMYPDNILKLFFGNPYDEAKISLQLLVFGFAFDAFVGSVGILTLAIGKTKTYLLYDIVGFSSSLLFNILLIPMFGIEGAAFATSLSIILWNITAVIFVYRFLKIQPFTVEHLKFSSVSITIFLIIYLIIKNLISGWLNMFVTIGIYGTLSLFLLKIFTERDKEGKEIFSILKKKLKLENSKVNMEF